MIGAPSPRVLRRCPCCGRWKAESAFYPDRRNPLGRRYRCKTCDNQGRVRRGFTPRERTSS